MFERVTCLMLDKRKHQQERIVEDCKAVSIKMEFFMAGNGTLFPAD